jgi:hypothetical protein
MKTVVHYYQEKLDKTKKLKATCELRLGIGDDLIVYASTYYTEYNRRGEPCNVTFFHQLSIDKKTGDITTTYKISNSGRLLSPKNDYKVKKNNFESLQGLTERGFYNGEKRIRYWGIKYNRILDKIFLKINTDLNKRIDEEFLQNKRYEFETSHINPLYDLIVDYHLYKKNVKPHNNVYSDIMEVYPKKKWLKLNDNKFLPAVLDELGIKSKYIIGEISSLDKDTRVNLGALNYLCKLFGDNYLDYIKKIEWKYFCNQYFNRKKKHTCRDEAEKRSIVSVLNSWNKEGDYTNLILITINELLELRSYIESKKYPVELKLKSKTPAQMDLLFEEWLLIRKHITVGYKIRYSLPEDFIHDMETPFNIDGTVFTPKVLVSEDDFRLEGITMKNCMAKQFINGTIHIFMALQTGRKRINLQFKRGTLIQSYSKANTPVPQPLFGEAVQILNEKFKNYPHLDWKKERYDVVLK